MFSREIGRVISVDSFKIMIELDENMKLQKLILM